jgi:hypothetical protein
MFVFILNFNMEDIGFFIWAENWSILEYWLCMEYEMAIKIASF